MKSTELYLWVSISYNKSSPLSIIIKEKEKEERRNRVYFARKGAAAALVLIWNSLQIKGWK